MWISIPSGATVFFFFNDTATTEIYTLSLHDALPICRPRYACRAREEAVAQAPAPERPITGGMATEALLAHVLVAKFCDHLPLYRHVWMAPALQGKSFVTRGGGRLRSCVRPLWCGQHRPLALMGSAGRGLIKRSGTSAPLPIPGSSRPVGSTDLTDRKSTRLNSSHANISYAVFCLKKK